MKTKLTKYEKLYSKVMKKIKRNNIFRQYWICSVIALSKTNNISLTDKEIDDILDYILVDEIIWENEDEIILKYINKVKGN